MGESRVTVRIAESTNERIKSALARSRLSRDQFIDYLLEEVAERLEQEQLSYEPLPIVTTVRRELGKPSGETLQSRLLSLHTVLSRREPNTDSLRLNEEPEPPKTDDPEALLSELVEKLQQNPRAITALATLMDLSRP